MFYCKLQEPTLSYGQMNFIINFRNLWLDLASWTRSYFVSIISGFGNSNMVGERLYRIPVDFHERLQLVFGREVSEKFITLLSNHIILMMNLAISIKSGDNQQASALTSQLYQNINEFAAYFNTINPFWSDIQWKNLLDQYTRLTIEELVALASGNFEKDIDIYDRITYHTLFLGDYMAEGILQFIEVEG